MLSKKKPSPIELKPAADKLATFHRDSGKIVTRMGGAKTGTAIYITTDPEVIRVFDEILSQAQGLKV